jgi:hypothetical protein
LFATFDCTVEQETSGGAALRLGSPEKPPEDARRACLIPWKML